MEHLLLLAACSLALGRVLRLFQLIALKPERIFTYVAEAVILAAVILVGSFLIS